MVIIHSWGTFPPAVHRVPPNVTLYNEVWLDAQAFFVWGWIRWADGWSPCLAVRKDVLERCHRSGSSVQALVQMAIVTHPVWTDLIRRNQVPEGRRVGEQ
jgi:hypothetical protein